MGYGTRESPYTREDLRSLIKEKRGKSEELDFGIKVFEYAIDLHCFDFKGANLEDTDLNSANLAGAYMGKITISNDTRLENVDWGNYILGEEIQGEKPECSTNNRIMWFNAILPTYRSLKTWYTQHGIFDVAGRFYYREKEVSRKVAERQRDKIAGWFSWAVFAHGEGWKRIMFWIAGFVLFFTCIYFMLDSFKLSTLEPNGFFNCMYYSAVSFVAVGYGGWIKESTGLVKGLGVLETFLGFFMMTLLLVTFVRKWTR